MLSRSDVVGCCTGARVRAGHDGYRSTGRHRHGHCATRYRVSKLGDALDIRIDIDLFSLSQQRELITGYVTDHLQVNGADEIEWSETVGQLRAINIDGIMHLRLLVETVPGRSVPDDFTVDYDGILATHDTHEMCVTAVHQKVDAASNAALVVVIDSDTPTLTTSSSSSSCSCRRHSLPQPAAGTRLTPVDEHYSESR